VARRAKRSEGWRFKVFYALYKRLFTLMTGRKIDFGNFLLIPSSLVARLVHMPEAWIHLAASVLRSRVPIVSVPTTRGQRYAGTSQMNVMGLLAHGLSAIAVFSDVVFVRLLTLVSAVSVLAFLVAASAVIVRLTTDLAIPGWATNVVSASAIILFQAISLSIVASLTMLGGRSGAVFIPARHAGEYVAERLILVETCPPNPKTSNISAAN
jgi:hypothetical protein